jgi:dienelactone hydrolase
MTSSSWKETRSDGSPMPMHVSVPEGAGPFPAMVVIQHQGGVDEFMQATTTQRLAAAGFVAAAPDLYHRDGPDCRDDLIARRSRLHDRRVANDVRATVAFLQRHTKESYRPRAEQAAWPRTLEFLKRRFSARAFEQAASRG